MDNIQITLSYNRFPENQNPNTVMGESYQHTFTITDEATYFSVLEKVEVMLKSLGYEFNGHLEFSDLVTDDAVQSDNVVVLRPEE